jgi:hypothetical protein
VTEAIFGLLGVLVGGLLNGAIASRQARRQQSDSVRAAARLLYARLLDSWGQVELMEASEEWYERGIAAPSGIWSQYEELFATALTARDWLILHDAVEQVATLNSMRPIGPFMIDESQRAPVEMDDDALHQVREVRAAEYDASPIVTRLVSSGTHPTLRNRLDAVRVRRRQREFAARTSS